MSEQNKGTRLKNIWLVSEFFNLNQKASYVCRRLYENLLHGGSFPPISTDKNISALLGAFVFSAEMSKQTALLAWGNERTEHVMQNIAGQRVGVAEICERRRVNYL